MTRLERLQIALERFLARMTFDASEWIDCNQPRAYTLQWGIARGLFAVSQGLFEHSETKYRQITRMNLPVVVEDDE